MILIKSISGMLAGAITGAILLPLILYPLLLAAAGGTDMNGGIAMGMVTGIAPLGTVLGGAAGLVLVLVLSRPREKRENSKAGIMVLGAITLFVCAYFVLLLILQGPAKISMRTEPDLHFEFKTNANSLVNNEAFKPRAELFGHHDNTIIPIPTRIRIDGETAYLSGKIHVEQGKGYEKLRLRAHFAPDLIVDATVPLLPGQEVLPGLREWDQVDFIRMPISDVSELGYSQEEHWYRYQILPHVDK